MTLCNMCFIETLVIACTVSEILAQIDHQGPKLDLSGIESDSTPFIF